MRTVPSVVFTADVSSAQLPAPLVDRGQGAASGSAVAAVTGMHDLAALQLIHHG